MIKKSLKEEKGITLVALIITIIVLLILAMVSIRLVMNGGIIDRAERGTQAYTEAEIGEQLKLVYSEYQMGQYQTPVDVQSRLQEIFGENNVQDVSVSNGKISAKIKVNGEFKTYEYDASTGKSTEIKPQAIGTLTKDNYGDYIDLGQSVIGTESTTDDWRILYNDKENNVVYAILADYLPTNNTAVAAAFKNNNGIYCVNSGWYSKRENFLNTLNNTTAWQSLIPEGLRSTCQVKGATTKEIIETSYKEKYNIESSFIYFYIDNDNSKGIDTLYMPHPDSSGNAYEGCYGYWLVSPVENNDNRVYYVRNVGAISFSGYSISNYGLCPVVSLLADLQVTSTTSNGVTVWNLAE